PRPFVGNGAGADPGVRAAIRLDQPGGDRVFVEVVDLDQVPTRRRSDACRARAGLVERWIPERVTRAVDRKAACGTRAALPDRGTCAGCVPEAGGIPSAAARTTLGV